MKIYENSVEVKKFKNRDKVVVKSHVQRPNPASEKAILAAIKSNQSLRLYDNVVFRSYIEEVNSRLVPRAEQNSELCFGQLTEYIPGGYCIVSFWDDFDRYGACIIIRIEDIVGQVNDYTKLNFNTGVMKQAYIPWGSIEEEKEEENEESSDTTSSDEE